MNNNYYYICYKSLCASQPYMYAELHCNQVQYLPERMYTQRAPAFLLSRNRYLFVNLYKLIFYSPSECEPAMVKTRLVNYIN